MKRNDSADGLVTIVLSERNLRDLMFKLDEGESARTIYNLSERCAVVAERDDVHYRSRKTSVPVNPNAERVVLDD